MLKTKTTKAINLKTPSIQDVKSSDSPDVIENYLTDEAGAIKGKAEKVFFPVNEAELSAVVKWANENNTKITASGGGTGITGSRAPLGGAVIATDRMVNVRDIPKMEARKIVHQGQTGEVSFYLDTDKNTVIVPAGLTLTDLMSVIRQHSLFYPPNPTEWSSTIGGNVSTNASGGRSFKFGAIRNWVKKARVILPTGELLEIHRGQVQADDRGGFEISYPGSKISRVKIPAYKMPEVKNASGIYSEKNMDLLDLFIGCEGLLGIFTEIELELVKAWGEVFGCIVFFPSEELAVEFVKEARKESRNKEHIIDTMTLDYFDGFSLEFMRKSHSDIPTEAKAAVFVEQMVPEDAEEEMMAWMELFEKYQVVEDWSALTDKDRERLRLFRHSLPENVNETVRQRGVKKMGMDLAAPDDRLDDLFKVYREEAGGSGLDYVIFGHIGDNNVHLNFLPNDKSEMDKVRETYLKIARKAIAMGGTISAEHGVGKKQFPVNGEMTPYLGLMYSPEDLRSIAEVKKSLDPRALLNRGNMIPESYLE